MAFIRYIELCDVLISTATTTVTDWITLPSHGFNEGLITVDATDIDETATTTTFTVTVQTCTNTEGPATGIVTLGAAAATSGESDQQVQSFREDPNALANLNWAIPAALRNVRCSIVSAAAIGTPTGQIRVRLWGEERG